MAEKTSKPIVPTQKSKMSKQKTPKQLQDELDQLKQQLALENNSALEQKLKKESIQRFWEDKSKEQKTKLLLVQSLQSMNATLKRELQRELDVNKQLIATRLQQK